MVLDITIERLKMRVFIEKVNDRRCIETMKVPENVFDLPV